MSSIPTSPVSQSHRRRSVRVSSFEVPQDASPSPYTSGTTNATNYSRRSSRTSQTSFIQTPGTPRPLSARSSRPPSLYHHRKSSSRLSIGSNISFGTDENGAGNLADELEDALEDEYEISNSSFLDGTGEGGADPAADSMQSIYDSHYPPDSEFVPYPGSLAHSPQSLLPPAIKSPTRAKSEKRKSRHQRSESKYDGSDYGPESDLEEDGITPNLAKRMSDVESLARMGIHMEDTLSEGGGVIKRTTHALKDLGPQAGIEANLSRIISAYTSMASHRTHKTRDLFRQAHSLLYGNVFELPEEVIDLLIADVDALSSIVASTHQESPLQTLQMLASQTLDLAHTLRALTDLLQESRVQANTATRKLKSVKEMVEDLCTEQELVETSMMLIQAGDWDRRCQMRQAAATCREVIEGFGNRWGLEVEERTWMRKPEAVVS